MQTLTGSQFAAEARTYRQALGTAAAVFRKEPEPMADLDRDLINRIASNAAEAYANSGGTKAAKLGDFRDDAYGDQGEAYEQAVADELQARGFAVGNAPEGSRIFARTQAEIDTYEERTGIDTTPDPS